jgi:hypothetical protein
MADARGGEAGKSRTLQATKAGRRGARDHRAVGKPGRQRQRRPVGLGEVVGDHPARQVRRWLPHGHRCRIERHDCGGVGAMAATAASAAGRQKRLFSSITSGTRPSTSRRSAVGWRRRCREAPRGPERPALDRPAGSRQPVEVSSWKTITLSSDELEVALDGEVARNRCFRRR